jgi:hypothetical protein
LINVGNAVKCIEEGQELLEQRLEKLEKALSEHMAEVRGSQPGVWVPGSLRA